MPNLTDITDEFIEPNGEWEGYQSVFPTQNAALREQKHVDIRSFVHDKVAAQMTMYLMDHFTMNSMDGQELSAFTHDSLPPATVVVVNNEGWTYGEVAPQEDLHNWNGITVTCPAGQITTTQSIITSQ